MHRLLFCALKYQKTQICNILLLAAVPGQPIPFHYCENVMGFPQPQKPPHCPS